MQIRTYEPRYRDELLAFLRDMFPEYPCKSDPDYFEWAFNGNPLGSSLGTYLLLFEGDRIVGQMATLRDRLRVGNGWHDCVWTCDFIVHSAHRGGLVMRQLFRHLMSSAPLVLAPDVAEATIPIYRALGWMHFPRLRSKYRPLRPSRLLAAARSRNPAVPIRSALKPVLRAADLILPLAERARGHIARLGATGGTVAEVERFDPKWDSDLASLLEESGVTQTRTAALLNWKFVERPIGRHQIFVLRGPGSELRGMLVLKWMAQPGIAQWVEIVDYLVAPNDDAGFHQLVGHATNRAAAAGFDFVRFRLSRPEHLAALASPLWLDHPRAEDGSVYAYSRDRSLLDALNTVPWHSTALTAQRAEPGRDEWPSGRGAHPSTLAV